MKFNKLSQQRLFHKTNLSSHVTTQHSRCEEMWSVDQLKPAFKSLFTVFLYLSFILSPLSLSRSLSVFLYLSTLPTRRFITHLHTDAAFPLLFLLLYRSISDSLSLTHAFCRFPDCLMQSPIWAAKRFFCRSPSVSIQTPLCFINMTSQKPVLLKRFPVKWSCRLYVACADRHDECAWSKYPQMCCSCPMNHLFFM